MVGRMIQTVLGMPFLLRCASHMIWPKWDGGGFPEMSLGTSKWCEEQVVAISWSASHTSSRYHGNPWKGSLSTSISVLKSVLSCSNFHPNDRMPVPSSLQEGGDVEPKRCRFRLGPSAGGGATWRCGKMKPAGPKVADRLRYPRGVKCMIYIDLWIFMVNCSWISMILMVWTWLLSGMLRSDLSVALVILESAWSENGLSTNRLPKYLNHDI